MVVVHAFFLAGEDVVVSCGDLLVVLDVLLVLLGELIPEVEPETLRMVTLSESDMLEGCNL